MAREDLAVREQRQRPAGREEGGRVAASPGAFQATAQAGAFEEEPHRSVPSQDAQNLGQGCLQLRERLVERSTKHTVFSPRSRKRQEPLGAALTAPTFLRHLVKFKTVTEVEVYQVARAPLDHLISP